LDLDLDLVFDLVFVLDLVLDLDLDLDLVLYLVFGFGFGVFDVSNMPILCQFALPRHRATGYGLMNLVGISSGAFITTLLGKSADSGNLGRDFAILGIVVLAAIVLQLTMLHPKQINKTS
jgi:hypothetical protein